jgi:hypothetical protein
VQLFHITLIDLIPKRKLSFLNYSPEVVSKKLSSYSSLNNLSVREKLAKLQSTYIRSHAKNSPSISSRNSKSKSPVNFSILNANKYPKTRPTSSRAANNTLHCNSRSEVLSIGSNSPRKFLQMQSDSNLLVVSIVL